MVSSAERCVAIVVFSHPFDQYFYLHILDLDLALVPAELPSSELRRVFCFGRLL